MKKIGIIVAMDKELKQLRQLFDNQQVIVEKCGIGKVNAALGAADMIARYHPDLIISSGCAGGCSRGRGTDDIQIQDVVVSSELCYHDVYCGKAIDDNTVYGQVQGLPARFQADPTLLAKARQLTIQTSASSTGSSRNSQLSIHEGLIVTGDWFVDSKEKMREIVAKFPDAKAVDMESAAIAQTCYLRQVPFISFRIISDNPLLDTDASQYHNFWDTIADNSFQVTKTFVESL